MEFVLYPKVVLCVCVWGGGAGVCELDHTTAALYLHALRLVLCGGQIGSCASSLLHHYGILAVQVSSWHEVWGCHAGCKFRGMVCEVGSLQPLWYVTVGPKKR